jgi:hypothetical protein
MVTDCPTGPPKGEMLEIVGGTVTVNVVPLLASPSTVTTTLPVFAPDGTGTVMLVWFHAVGVVGTPSKAMILVP